MQARGCGVEPADAALFFVTVRQCRAWVSGEKDGGLLDVWAEQAAIPGNKECKLMVIV